MRRALPALALVVATLAVLVLLGFTAREAPLPWRGALTRLAWAELARGAYPGIRCVQEMAGAEAGLPPTASLPVTGHYACSASDDARRYRASLRVAEGWVTGTQRVWWRAPGEGRALADSLARELDASMPGSARCDRGEHAASPAVVHRWARWRSPDGVVTELLADSLGEGRPRDGAGWRVRLERHYRRTPCPGR